MALVSLVDTLTTTVLASAMLSELVCDAGWLTDTELASAMDNVGASVPEIGVGAADRFPVKLSVAPESSVLLRDRPKSLLASVVPESSLSTYVIIRALVSATLMDGVSLPVVAVASRRRTIAAVPRVATDMVPFITGAAVEAPVVTEPVKTTEPIPGFVAPIIVLSARSVTVPQADTPVAVHDSAEPVVPEACVVKHPITASLATNPGFEPIVVDALVVVPPVP